MVKERALEILKKKRPPNWGGQVQVEALKGHFDHSLNIFYEASFKATLKFN